MLQPPRTADSARLSEAELSRALFNGDITLPRLLRHRALAHPETLALREKEHGIWKRYTWAHYYARARAVALGLKSLGLQRGDRIAIAAENVPEWFYADLGAEMLGVIVVGIYPTNPWSELQYIVRHCGARVVFTGDQEQTDKVYDAMANEGGVPAVEAVVCIDMKGLRGYAQQSLMSFDALCGLGADYAAANPLAEAELDSAIDAASPDDTCILVYTSGTTGPPKGAMLSHRNLVFSAAAYADAIEVGKRNFTAVCYLPLCHVAERCYSMATQLALGGEVSFAESIDTVAVNIREIAPSFFIGVPRIYEKLKQNFTFRLGESGRFRRVFTHRLLDMGRKLSDRRQLRDGAPALVDRIVFQALYWALFRNIQRYIGLDRSFHRLCAGASVSPETLRFFDVIGLPVSQGYGLTEAAGCLFIQHHEQHHHNRLGGCGLAIRGTEWKLTEDKEILLRSEAVFAGYFRDEEATKATVGGQGWLSTGDIVDLMPNGEITVVDRKKAIIITAGGKNIAPSEVENSLKDSDFIKEAIVVGEAKKFVGALIQIDYDNVGRWAQQRGLAYTNYKSLALLPEVTGLIQTVVDVTNKRFARVENVRRFVILEKELDHDDGELTATQKVRRALIETKFARELEIIYGTEA